MAGIWTTHSWKSDTPARRCGVRSLAVASLLLQPSPLPWPYGAGAAWAQAVPAPDATDLDCLATAIAYEAGFEPVEGRRAVAEVVLNRVRTPGFPKTVCGVVFQGATRQTGCQFSFTCDGALRRRLPARVQAEARAIAEQALAGSEAALVPGATHYHASYVSPRWAPALLRITQIGAHIFYRPLRTGAPTATRAAAAAPGMPPARPEPFAPWGLAPPMAAAAP